MSVDLQGKTALVTGAASGIGAACARRYSAAGAHVICTDVADGAGQQVADEIGGWYRHLDVADSSAWAKLAAELTDDPGRLDLVHLNAGVMLGLGDIAAMTDEDYHRIIGSTSTARCSACGLRCLCWKPPGADTRWSPAQWPRSARCRWTWDTPCPNTP